MIAPFCSHVLCSSPQMGSATCEVRGWGEPLVLLIQEGLLLRSLVTLLLLQPITDIALRAC
jgi:hypothetical protein